MSDTTGQPVSNTCSFYDPSCSLEWLRDEFQSFSIWLFDSLLNAIALLFESIPVPDFFSQATTYTIPPSVSWAATAFNLPAGIAIIVTAYTARFILRRIPIIG